MHLPRLLMLLLAVLVFLSITGRGNFPQSRVMAEPQQQEGEKKTPLTGNLTAQHFDLTAANSDGNKNVSIKDGKAILMPEGDEFGSTFFGWTELEGNSIFKGGWAPKNSAELKESTGLLTCSDGGQNTWAIGAHRCVHYRECDLVVRFSNTDSQDRNYVANNVLMLWLDGSNAVGIVYDARKARNNHPVQAWKRINSTWTTLAASGNVGVQSCIWLRLKRTTAGDSPNTFSFFYALEDPYKDPAKWVKITSSQVRTVGAFDEKTNLWPVIGWYCAQTQDKYTPAVDYYRQWTKDMPAQRYAFTSPEILVAAAKDTAYAFDAGDGKVWKLSGASCEKSEPGRSVIKFKIGCSDTGKSSDVTWIDKKTLRIKEIKANAAAGKYDGHHFIHVKAQLNSFGPDQPSLKSFSIEGTQTTP